MKDSILIFLQHITEGRAVSPALFERLQQLMVRVVYRKGEFWLGRDRSDIGIAFILDGSAMSFRFQNGGQRITHLWNPCEIIIEGSRISPYKHREDRLVFLEDSEVLVLGIQDIEALQSEFLDVRFLVNQILAKTLVRMESLYYLMKFETPHIRLEQTLRIYTRPFNLLSTAQKASYLGISRPSLYNLG